MRKFGRLGVFLVVVCLCFVGSVYADLNYGLVAYYPFNGNSNDASENSNDGTVNGATLTVDRFGNTNSAYSFDGEDDYISADHSSTLNISGDITVSVWINRISSTGSDKILIKEDNHYALFIVDNKVLFYGEQSPGYGIFAGGERSFYGITLLNLNQWYHLIITADGTDAKIYINGVLDNQTTQIAPLKISSNELDIGTEISSPVYFNGSIDDIRIYNRALTEHEIQQLYNEQSCDCPETCSQAELNAKYNEGYKNGLAACPGFTQADIDAAKNEGYANGKGVGFEEGIEYCKKNPSECGFDVPACDSCCNTTPSDNACVAIESDLTLSIPCAGFGEKQYSFNLLPYKNPDSPFGYFWQLDLNSFGIK